MATRKRKTKNRSTKKPAGQDKKSTPSPAEETQPQTGAGPDTEQATQPDTEPNPDATQGNQAPEAGEQQPPVETKKPEATPEVEAEQIVQLQSNQAGHLAGETFTYHSAGHIGILDHCRPFPGQDNRAVDPDDVTTR